MSDSLSPRRLFLRSWTPYCKFRLKLKKIGKTARPFRYDLNQIPYTSLVSQMVKHLFAMPETRVHSLGWEDPLEKEMAAHSSTLAWKIPWMEEPGRLQSMGSQRVRQGWTTSTFTQGYSLLLHGAGVTVRRFPTSKGRARDFQKNIYFCFIDYAKAFDCVDHNKLWKILKEMGIPDHRTCLLRNLHAGQEAIVRTKHGTTDWFQTGKGVH